MVRIGFAALLLVGCTSTRGSKVDDDSDIDWPYTSGTATATATGPGGSGTGTGTGTGPGGSGTGTGTGTPATGTGSGSGGGSTGTGTGTGGTTPGACVAAIPNNATVIDTNTTVTTNGGVYWVCRQDVLSFAADNATIYVENQGDVVVNGTNNTVYIRASGDATIFQSGNTFFPEQGAAINDAAPPNTINTCTSFVWDLSNAPTPGC